MSSFTTPHKIYLFDMKNGKKKVGYGASPQEAFENLRFRLTDYEVSEILADKYQVINQREFRVHIGELG
jgi:hypothetical protein